MIRLAVTLTAWACQVTAAAGRHNQHSLEAFASLEAGQHRHGIRIMRSRQAYNEGSLADNRQDQQNLFLSGAIEAPDVKFYLYELPANLNLELLACYKKLKGVELWDDFSEEKGQNGADVWMHKLLEKHPARTRDPDKATLFFVPFYGFLSSFFLGIPLGSDAGSRFSSELGCNGTSHYQRTADLANFLIDSKHFAAKPEAHAMVVSFWAVARERTDPVFPPASVVTGPLWKVLQRSVLLVHEPRFSSMESSEEYRNWPGKLLTIPYVAKPQLVNEELREFLGRKKVSFFFQGELHAEGWTNSNASVRSLDARVALARAFENQSGAHIVDTFKHHKDDASYEMGMRDANFCLVPKGDTPTSSRLFDAIAANCVPLILSDDISLPFSTLLDWKKFSVQLPEAEALKASGSSSLLAQATHQNYMTIDSRGRQENSPSMTELLSMPTSQLLALQMNLLRVRGSFIYGQGTPQNHAPGGALDMILAQLGQLLKASEANRSFL